MKAVKIIAFAFAAVCFAAGCAKVGEPGGESMTVITAGFENTRTVLQQDGKKVYWQDGDAICVNGAVSAALSIEECSLSCVCLGLGRTDKPPGRAGCGVRRHLRAERCPNGGSRRVGQQS